MRKPVICLLSVLFVSVAFVTFAKQDQDLSGTWAGDMSVSGSSDPVTLYLVRSKDIYSGSISDAAGLANNVPLRHVVAGDSTVTFDFYASNQEDYIIEISLTLMHDNLIGTWVAQDGTSGTVYLSRIVAENFE